MLRPRRSRGGRPQPIPRPFRLPLGPVAFDPPASSLLNPAGAFAVPLAAVSNSPGTVWNVLEHYEHLGLSLRVDLLANGSSPFQAWRR